MGNGTTVISLGSDYDATRATALEAALTRIEGIESVEFNYTSNKVTVKFDSGRVSLGELKAIVMREKKHQSRSKG
jgi:copper chaperone CopZ